MSRYIDVHILQYDGQAWRNIKLYRKKDKKFIPIDLFPFPDEQLFDILNGDDGDFPWSCIDESTLPTSVINELRKAQNSFCFDFHEVNFADLKIYSYENPKVRDYDYDGENFEKEAWKDTPLVSFIKHIENILNLADPYWNIDRPSDVRIVYWFND